MEEMKMQASYRMPWTTVLGIKKLANTLSAKPKTIMTMGIPRTVFQTVTQSDIVAMAWEELKKKYDPSEYEVRDTRSVPSDGKA
jgi:hypothetical protein